LSAQLPQGAEVGVLGFAADFFATNEREIAFIKWLQANRMDVQVHVARFARMDEAAAIGARLVSDLLKLAGLCIVWDTPAPAVSHKLCELGKSLPSATVDLGNAVVIDIARTGSVCCIAAQQPDQQGIAAAQTVILSLLGRPVPAWIAMPSITRDNVVESFKITWRQPAPKEVIHALDVAR
jgi:ribose transport system substrate-binding protein